MAEKEVLQLGFYIIVTDLPNSFNLVQCKTNLDIRLRKSLYALD